MKKIGSILLATLLAGSMLAGCGDKEKESSSTSTPQEINVTAGYTRYDVKESTRTTEGFGTQFDTLIVEPENALSAEEWQQQIDALKLMNLQNVRIRFFPEWYERGNDNDDYTSFDYDSENVDFNSLEMQDLYKLLDVFETNDVKVDLSWYGCRTTFKSQDGKIEGSWLGGKYGDPDVTSWSVMPHKGEHPKEEFAESVAAGLNYLINTKKYTCLYEYSIFPEPEGMMTDTANFKEIIGMVNSNLEGYGIKDKILFSGPADYNNNAEVFEKKYLSQDFGFEKATSSVYCFHQGLYNKGTGGLYDNSSLNAVMLEFAQTYVQVCDKYGISWGIAESGTSNGITPVTNGDTETYERALFMARFLINMVNGGCTNIKYFVFSECFYDGFLNELGLFKFRQDDFKARPVWYSWSLICHYTDFGSKIHPITDSYGDRDDTDVCIVAFKLPDGSWTYLAANNNATESKKVAIVNQQDSIAGKMKLHRMTEATIPEDRGLKLIDVDSEVDVSSGVAHFTIPAKGFVVLSNKV